MSGYIGPLPVPQGIQRKQSFTATASQTTFNTNGYTDGNFINVYLNGVRLINGTDYTATNGSDIVLTTGASASDVLDFETFDTFELVDQQFENVTLKNPTHEDTDGGRESAVSFKGEQSGGEISTLAQIQASHDGTSDDQKGDLIFKTNDGSDNDAPTEAMRINSDSQLLVGETTAIGSNVIATFATSNSSTATSAGNGAAIAVKNTDTTDNNYSTIYFANSADGIDSAIYGVHEDADGTGTNRSGELVFATADTGGGVSERMRILSGGGLTFNGDTAAANALDDYEEGTWSPKWVNTSNQDIFDTAPTVNMARYTKIGDTVTASAYFNNPGSSFGNTANYSATSDVNIGGLPFTSNRSGVSDFYGGTVGWYDNWNGYTGGTPMCYSATNSSRVVLVFADNADVATVKQQDVDNTGSGIIFTVTYKTAS